METALDLAKASYLRVRVFECTRAKQRQSFQTDVARAVVVRIIGVTARLAGELDSSRVFADSTTCSHPETGHPFSLTL